MENMENKAVMAEEIQQAAAEVQMVPEEIQQAAAEVAKLIEEQNYPQATRLAIQNTLKVMDGEHGGGFYVQYVMDMGTCYGWLRLTIVYPDGEYKSILLFKNCFKETDLDSGNGVYVDSGKDYGKKLKGGYPKYYPWDGPLANNYVSLTQYENPRMSIPSDAIWKKIVDHYHEIPIVKINHTGTLEQLITELRECATERSQEYGSGFMDDHEKCYISREDFERIAEDNGWAISKVKLEIEMLGLFVRDTNSKGYQKTKKINGEIKRFYVLKKTPLESPATISTKSLNDTKFTTQYKTKDEITIKHLQKSLSEMTAKYNQVVAENNLDKDFEV